MGFFERVEPFDRPFDGAVVEHARLESQLFKRLGERSSEAGGSQFTIEWKNRDCLGGPSKAPAAVALSAAGQVNQ